MYLDLVKAGLFELAEQVAFTVCHSPATTSSDQRIIDQIEQKGYAVLKNFYSAELVSQLVSEVDRLFQANPQKLWSDETGSDQRYFHADLDSPPIASYLNDPLLKRLRAYFSVKPSASEFTLANKVSYREGNLGSGGGWHRDSPTRRELKTILYLKPVDESNGPFEFIEGSHTKRFLFQLISKNLARFRQYRFTDAEINQILFETKACARTFLGEPGDLILVNTKGIHRGKPIQARERYALTNYFC